MAINVIDVYLKNEPGSLAEVTGILELIGINIYCIAHSGEEDYIPVSIVVSNTEKAVHELRKRDFELEVEEGIACEIPHHPGGLHSILKIIAEAEINITSAFSAPSKVSGSAVIIFRVNDTEKTEVILKKNWIKLLEVEDFSK